MRSSLAACLPSSLADTPGRLRFLLLALSMASILVSIAASQALLAAALAVAAWLRWSAKDTARLRLPVTPPLVFFLSWTLLAALVSSDVLRDLVIVKKFFLFLLLFLVPAAAREADRRWWIYHAVFAVAGLSSVTGIVQHFMNPERDLLHRISGFMSQWMTYSGLLMLVAVLLVAYALSVSPFRRLWLVPLAALVFASLYLSYTRNAWLGTAAGVAVVLLLRRPRAFLPVIAVLAVLVVLAPDRLHRRIVSGFDTDDTTTRGRIELMETSLRLIRDNPWFGVGPKGVNSGALRYRGTQEFPDWLYQHMHNNVLQIAAERGIPAALLWLWLMGRLAWDASRLYISARRAAPHSPDRSLASEDAMLASTAALGAWVALLISGIFEYNFGDSEVLMLFLFLMSLPYAAEAPPSTGEGQPT